MDTNSSILVLIEVCFLFRKIIMYSRHKNENGYFVIRDWLVELYSTWFFSRYLPLTNTAISTTGVALGSVTKKKRKMV
jgi:hypothetical protein